MLQEDSRRLIQAEMDAARQAREGGNEGRARVCARRAAGHAIRDYRRAIGAPDKNLSAYTLLRWISSLPSIEPPLRASAERLAARVTTDHALPHPHDPLADAAVLIEGLLEKLPPPAGAHDTQAGEPPGRSRGQEGFGSHS